MKASVSQTSIILQLTFNTFKIPICTSQVLCLRNIMSTLKQKVTGVTNHKTHVHAALPETTSAIFDL